MSYKKKLLKGNEKRLLIGPIRYLNYAYIFGYLIGIFVKYQRQIRSFSFQSYITLPRLNKLCSL